MNSPGNFLRLIRIDSTTVTVSTALIHIAKWRPSFCLLMPVFLDIGIWHKRQVQSFIPQSIYTFSCSMYFICFQFFLSLPGQVSVKSVHQHSIMFRAIVFIFLLHIFLMYGSSVNIKCPNESSFIIEDTCYFYSTEQLNWDEAEEVNDICTYWMYNCTYYICSFVGIMEVTLLS